MRNIKLCVEFDGTDFVGWQRQKDGMSVQQSLEEAAGKVVGHQVSITGAGRTDRGVHALGQVAGFRTGSTIPCDRVPQAINFYLPETVRVRSAGEVADNFHPCRSSTGKHYRYTVWCGRIAPAISRRYITQVPWALNTDSMARAGQAMEGKQDFRAFRSFAKGQEHLSTIKEIWKVLVRRFGSWILVEVLGSGFVYTQVRTMVGTLIEVGRGKMEPRHVKDILKSGDRKRAGPTAPAKGLCLVRVFYDSEPHTWYRLEDPAGVLRWAGFLPL